MDPAAGFCSRDPLDPVDTGFVFKPGPGAPARDHKVHILHASDADLLVVQSLHLPASSFRIVNVHAVDFGGKEGCLVSSGPGPDLEDDVLFVVGILGDQQDPDLLVQVFQALFAVGELFSGQLTHFLVALLFQDLPGFLHRFHHLFVFGISLHDGGQVALFLHQTAEPGLVGHHLGTCKLSGYIFISEQQCIQFFVHNYPSFLWRFGKVCRNDSVLVCVVLYNSDIPEAFFF